MVKAKMALPLWNLLEYNKKIDLFIDFFCIFGMIYQDAKKVVRFRIFKECII
jgi:hypothetical protein